MTRYNISFAQTRRFVHLSVAAMMSCASALMYSQPRNIFDYNSVNRPSAETFGMTRYGGQFHNLYSGAMTYSIPLYEYSDPDFTLPLSLEYAFDGFRPDVNSGSIGYGWRLDCGGVITREVNGIPDETDWGDGGDVGFLCTVRDGVFWYDIVNSTMSWPYMGSGTFSMMYPQQYLMSQVKNMNLFSDMPTFYDHISSQPYTRRHYDASPDLFHFSFNGIQGDFMLKRNGEFEVFNSNVPYGELSVEWVLGTNMGIRSSRFVITTGDGSRYHFGRTGGNTCDVKSALEFSYTGTVWDERVDRDFMTGDDDEAWRDFVESTSGDYQYSDFIRNQIAGDGIEDDWPYSYNPHGTVSAWKLVKVEAPNGRVLEFGYGRTYADFRRVVRYHPAMGYASQNGWCTAASTPYQTLISTFSCPLESVSVDGREVIVLTYSDRQKEESNVNCFTAFPQQNPTGSNWDAFPLTEMGRVSGDPNCNSLVQKRLSNISVYNDQESKVEDINLVQFHTSDSSGSAKMFLSSVQSLRKGVFNLQYNIGQDFVFPLRDTPCVDHWGYWNGDTRLAGTNLRALVDISALKDGGLYDQLDSDWKDACFSYAVKGALTSVTFPTGGSVDIEYEPHTAARLLERDSSHYPYLTDNEDGLVPGGVRVRSITELSGDMPRASLFRYCSKDGLDGGGDGDEEESGEYGNGGSGILLYMPRYACHLSCSIGSMGNYACIAFSTECEGLQQRESHIAYSSVCRINPDASVDEYSFIDYDSYPDSFGPSSVIAKKYLCENYTVQSSEQYSFIHKFSPPADDNCAMRGRLKKETRWSAADGEKCSETEYCYSHGATGATVSLYSNLAVCYMQSEFVFRYPCLADRIERMFERGSGDMMERSTHVTINSHGQVSRRKTTETTTGEYRQSEYAYYHESYPSAYGRCPLMGAVRSVKEYSKGNLFRETEYVYSGDNINPGAIIERGLGSYRAVTVSYNSLYRPVRVSYPGGAFTEYSWSADGRHLLDMTENAVGNTTAFTWRDLVGLEAVSLPSGLGESYEYDSRSRLLHISDTDGHFTDEYFSFLLNEDPCYVFSGDECNYTWHNTYVDSTGTFVSDTDYYDELGYPVQRQSSDATPAGGTLVQPIVYDNMRRADAISYLPYVTSGYGVFRGQALSEQASWYSAGFGGEAYPFGSTEYESGYGGRPLSRMKPGAAYRSGNRKAVTDYSFNDAADSVWRMGFDPCGFCIMPLGRYPANSLHRITYTDEDGRSAIVFIDSFGRKVLSRQTIGGRNADTYFAYDSCDSLVCVISPEGVPFIEDSMSRSSDETSLDVDFLDEHCFTWEYDSRGNLLRSHVPGGGTSSYRYDDRDRLTYFTDSDMIGHHTCIRRVYDNLDRLSEEYFGAGFSDEDFYDFALLRRRAYYDASGNHIPTGRGLGFVPDEVARAATLCTERCLTMPSYELVFELPVSTDQENTGPEKRYVERAFYYDGKGRPIQTVERSNDGWTGRYSTKYDFTGNVLATLESHTPPAPAAPDNPNQGNTSGTADELLSEYTYDKRGRMLSCALTLNGNAQRTVTYTYDGLGRLVTKEFCDSSGNVIAAERWDRTLQGWVKSQNAEFLEEEFFSQILHYSDAASGTPLYSGAVSEVGWQHGENGDSHRYAYSYDALGRLSGTSHLVNDESVTSDLETGFSYDLQGNLLALRRYGSLYNSFTGNHLENDLTYTYSDNRLAAIRDSALPDDAFMLEDNPGTVYEYACDCNGRITGDGHQDLGISYNILNLPKSIETEDGMPVEYTYLSDGTKYSVLHGNGQALRLYRGSFVYSAVYDESEYTVSDISLESVATPEGRLYRDSSSTMDLWYVRDYLGNVRAIIDLGAQNLDSALLEENDYLPFGTKISASQPSLTSNDYRYAGKEEQASVLGASATLLDFGARFYDPWACRWTTIDPMAGKYAGMSPYCYCACNPVVFVDPDGSDWYQNNTTGRYSWFAGSDELSGYTHKSDRFWSNGKYYSLFGAIVNEFDTEGNQLGLLFESIDDLLISQAKASKFVPQNSFCQDEPQIHALFDLHGSEFSFVYFGKNFKSEVDGTKFWPANSKVFRNLKIVGDNNLTIRKFPSSGLESFGGFGLTLIDRQLNGYWFIGESRNTSSTPLMIRFNKENSDKFLLDYQKQLLR